MAGFLAYAGLENETDCTGWLLSADWSQGGSHPKSFAAEEVNLGLCAPSDLQPRSLCVGLPAQRADDCVTAVLFPSRARSRCMNADAAHVRRRTILAVD